MRLIALILSKRRCRIDLEESHAIAARPPHPDYHISLPRPHRLLDAMQVKYSGQAYDEKAYQDALRRRRCRARTGAERHRHRHRRGILQAGVFHLCARERLDGFELRPELKLKLFEQEVAAFPEYYQQYFKQAMMGGAIVALAPVVCVGPVKYRGEKLVQADIANVKAAAAAAGVANENVLPATAPSRVGINEYYKTDEDYFHALAAELSNNG